MFNIGFNTFHINNIFYKGIRPHRNGFAREIIFTEKEISTKYEVNKS